MSGEPNELKNIVEAALLVAGQPLTIERMADMFPEDSRPAREEIRAALEQLEAEYAERGIELKRIDKGYRLQTREKYSAFLARLVEERPARYSRALLETLAIIAYRQPVTRGDIEEIRGVAVSTEIIKTLLARGWIREVGRKEVPGRPVLYGTTRAFLEYFNLSKLEDLPPLAELRDIGAIAAELDGKAGAGDPAAAHDGGSGAEPGSEAQAERAAGGAEDGERPEQAANAAESVERTPLYADSSSSGS
ncbi:MAG TPA: SMC-Scp complex subunit ScpB [Burkholderiales bacterium]